MTNDELNQWIVYDHPTDYPNVWVARRWTVSARGVTPTDDVRTADTVEELRQPLRDAGLIMLTRSPEDDPAISEIWT